MKSISLLNRLSILATMVSLTVQAANVPPEIRNLKVQQRPGTYLVDVTFDLVDPDSLNGVFLSLEASSDNGANFNLSAKTVTGDISLVKPGVGKKMVWDAFTDWPDKYTPNAKVRVVANDSLPQGPTQGPEGFVWIPPGKFMMGSPLDEPGRSNDEIPHEVYIAPGFWMSDHEVTQAEYQAIMVSNPSRFQGDVTRPVEDVSWLDAVQFCEKLTDRERASGRITVQQAYRLPTEAEWEYAARAGSVELRYGDLDAIAWVTANSSNQTHPVKQKAANPWGLYDMIGNVSEWCSDWYGVYPTGSVGNPTGPGVGTGRVIRGGAWNGSGADRHRFAYRGGGGAVPYWHHIDQGFRIALSLVR
jgi:formylglycine-generating enzyme required for sulfatase activity